VAAFPAVTALSAVQETSMEKKQILVIGLEPELVDFSTMPDMNAGKVRAGLETDEAKLAALAYDDPQ
jgi:hypothetical protein